MCRFCALALGLGLAAPAYNAAGSFPPVGLGNSVSLVPPPVTISIVASAAGTVYTCAYR